MEYAAIKESIYQQAKLARMSEVCIILDNSGLTEEFFCRLLADFENDLMIDSITTIGPFEYKSMLCALVTNKLAQCAMMRHGYYRDDPEGVLQWYKI